ncbi:GntR family transcriptional regulator [Clostridium estertheticum]|uniref:GntR family transcriptional regulator n=1 Tax=Clostridium estertheticum TaxID=238834 RepID=UPI001C7DFC86|nr:winged helix-turn-helix domain-containing protein [Clostridium estertheticum]MBX4263033.1 winged helix-turn-helix domain-containing protein [Clostridium estertheticum]MBX4271093.1 winged helix-turn-helix domain-containing protein [Clostridium estertheticum]WLC78327.1 winged helix-turn-helix domain-containing protein [Clostridium estertheticum]WLC89354.1 winged helix-turn-helix domain-containing protein [Clostridium estertheticum]
MDIEIIKNNGVLLHIQVKMQIMDAIKKGTLRVGTKLPTERELSQQLNVSRNTVSAAYKALEQEGALKSYQGKGTFVVEEAVCWESLDVKKKIIKFIDLGLEEALEIGMEPEVFLDLVIQRVVEKKQLMEKVVAIYVECNIEQAKMFSEQLSNNSNMNVMHMTISELEKMDNGTKDKIGKAEFIITTFNHINEVTRLTAGLNKEILGVAIKPNLEPIVKIARYGEHTKFAFVCISEQFMFKVKGALEKAGLSEIDIEYSNTTDYNELKDIIQKSDVMIVSPGRFTDVNNINSGNKEIIQFLYSLDGGSVKALKSRIIEIEFKK